VTEAYRAMLLAAVRRRPRSVGAPFSRWTLQRLVDYLAEHTLLRVSDECVRRALQWAGMVLSCPQHTISRPAPEDAVNNRRLKRPANQVKPGAVFYDADECNRSWMPTLRAMWSPQGLQVHDRHALPAA
jgi:hypothetical protein